MTDPNLPDSELHLDGAADATGAVESDAIESPDESTDAPAPSAVSLLANELAEARDKHLRLAAEFDNFRRRTVRDRQEAEQRGMANLLRGLLETIDDIARFAHVDPATTDAKTLAEGVAMVEKKVLKSLAGHGLEVINPVEHPFDPALHEAITTTPAASEAEDHLVAQVFQVGYVFNGVLLRPARVVVRQWNG